MKPYRLRGRARSGIGMDLVYGILLLVLTILFSFDSNLFIDPQITIIWLFVFGMTVAFFYHFSGTIRMKTLEVDDLGIRYFIGSRKKWDLPWSIIDSVSCSAFSGRYPRIGFNIVSAKKGYPVNDRDQMGTRKELEQAFEIIAIRAANHNIDINDPLGWATDVLPDKYIDSKQKSFSHLKGKWHMTGRRGDFEKTFLPYILSFLIGGVGILLLLPNTDYTNWGYILLVVPILFLPIILATYLTSIVEIWFDDIGVRIQFPRNREKAIRWTKIKNVGVSPKGGFIGIATFNGKGWSGFKFEEDVCEALQIQFSAIEKRRGSAPGRGKW